MATHAICPHCGRELDESIPSSLVGTIELRCPHCEMTFTYQQETDTALPEDGEIYFSTGFFRRKSISGTHNASEEKPMFFYCLVYLIIIPLIGIGFLLLLAVLNAFLGWLI
jgi:hypothetical protein